MLVPICLQVPPNPSNAGSSSSHPTGDELAVVKQLRSRISRMERELVTIHAGVAVTKKKGEMAAEFAQYAQDEMAKATESLHCK